MCVGALLDCALQPVTWARGATPENGSQRRAAMLPCTCNVQVTNIDWLNKLRASMSVAYICAIEE